MQVDMSKVPNLEERQAITALDDANSAAYKAYIAAHSKAFQAARKAAMDDPTVVALSAKHDETQKAYEEYDCPALLTDYNEDPVRCALSGLILFEDDEVIKDDHTNEHVLRCLVLPPREVAVDDTADDDELGEQDAA